MNDEFNAWYTLRSGEDIWPNYDQLRCRSEWWRIMRTEVSIRGNFDNLIFFTELGLVLDAPFECFYPSFNAKWVLILERQFNDAGVFVPTETHDPPHSYDYTQEILDEHPFLNVETLFKVEGGAGAVLSCPFCPRRRRPRQTQKKKTGISMRF